ncbi:MAG: sigma-70 family RNA polymerase sigma factor [Algibacter sp.]|uniref:RNA polymerase sigma factor n=1 Tax=Algibacter sp. TaxID=1872428 RepID=UPI003299977C
MTDEQLVSAIVVKNDSALFEILYDRFSKRIYNKCYSFVHNEDEAKDLTQDIFLKLYVKLSSFKGGSKFSTWVYSFTYNHCVNYLSRNKVKKYEKRLPDFYDAADLTEESFSNQDLVDKLNYGLSMIPAEDKSILILKYQNNLSIKNIEEVLGLGTSAVKMRIKRAKEKLVNSCGMV